MQDPCNAMVGAMLLSLVWDYPFFYCTVTIVAAVEAFVYCVQVCVFVQYVLSMM
jgi:hypothetical protein